MSDYKVGRQVFIWLLVIQAFLLLPHAIREPLLVIPFMLVCTIWRAQVYRMRWPYPHVSVKLLLMLASVFLVAFLQGSFTVAAAVDVLLIAFMLKILEMKSLRDVLLVVYLSYFVLVTDLLFEQDIISGLYGSISLLLVTTALVAVHQREQARSFFLPLKTASKLAVFSLPLMFVAFIVFPRIEPLWSVPQPSSIAKTGMTNRMSPGSIEELVKDDALAFRATFDDGYLPEKTQLYWRSVVLSEFDGTSWTQDRARYLQQSRLQGRAESQVIDYEIMLEPSGRRWLAALEAISGIPKQTEYLADLTLQAQEPANQRKLYRLQTTISDKAVLASEEYRHILKAAKALPHGLNPQSVALAKQWRSSVSTEQQYIDKVLAHFTQENFYYSLQPQALGRHSVDEFLFETRRGFCSHYAASFVVLMRAAGIAARVVAGYQGGELNPFENYISVRQSDAHAWAEVWLNDRWQRVDPTFAVAPERIEQGSEQSLQGQQGFLENAGLSSRKYPLLNWFKKLEYRYEQLNYLWSSAVLNYEGETQENFIKALLGKYSWQRIASLILLCFSLVAGSIFLWVALPYRRPRINKRERYYQIFVKKMAKKGVRKTRTEGAADFSLRCQQALPHCSEKIAEISHYYQLLNYSKLPNTQAYRQLLQHFRHVVIHFNPDKADH